MVHESDPYEPEEPHPSEYDGENHVDSNDREYNPFSGSITPSPSPQKCECGSCGDVGHCNAPLTNWRERYDEPRYCMRLPESKFVDDGSQFCKDHKSREAIMERASDLFETGLHVKGLVNFFNQVAPWKEVYAVAIFESLLSDSTYNFETTDRPYTVDFSDTDEIPIDLKEKLDDDDTIEMAVPVPSNHFHRWTPLWNASADTIKKININETLMTEGLEGESLAAHGTDDSGQIVDTETEDVEHHLNLPYSRLVKDHKAHLKQGGVPIENDSDVEVNLGGTPELIMDLTGKSEDPDHVPQQPHYEEDMNPLNAEIENATDE